MYLQIHSWSLQTEIQPHCIIPGFLFLEQKLPSLNFGCLNDMKQLFVTLVTTQLPVQSLLRMRASFCPDKSCVLLT